MKIINFVLVLIILVCGSQLSHGEKLNCIFRDVSYHLVGSFYSCFVSSFLNPYNNITIDGYSEEHTPNKNDADVKAIWFHESSTKYIPTNLGTLFNLTALQISSSELIEIKTKDFHGMQELEFLGFNNNKLSSVPFDAFATLTKLRIIYLSSNQIEELPNGIFKHNLELEIINLQHNKIKYLATEIFNDLKKLNFVDLDDNICVDKRYFGTTEIIQLKKDIIMNCTNPNEFPATTTYSTTQNPMEVKIIEMQEQIRKLEKEFREAKKLQQMIDSEAKKVSNRQKLNCVFDDQGYYLVGLVYSCKVTSLDNTQNNLIIEGYSGVHMTNKNDADVKGIWIHDTNTKYIPTNLGTFSNLTLLYMVSTQLIEIKTKYFHGMQDLKSMSFLSNKLTSVPLDAFATLKKLRLIDLSSNQLEDLPNDIFKNNLELEEIYLSDNKIKYLGTEMFNGLQKLDYVDLFGNICLNHFYVGATQITLLKDDIKLNCTKPN